MFHLTWNHQASPATDGKRPDGVTVVPWSRGKLLVWDATCPDTYATSYTTIASQEAGVVAAIAEERKKAKYTCLSSYHIFTPVAVETAGVFGPETSRYKYSCLYIYV